MGAGLLMAAHILCPRFLLTWEATRKGLELSLVFCGFSRSQLPHHLKDSYEGI